MKRAALLLTVVASLVAAWFLFGSPRIESSVATPSAPESAKPERVVSGAVETRRPIDAQSFGSQVSGKVRCIDERDCAGILIRCVPAVTFDTADESKDLAWIEARAKADGSFRLPLDLEQSEHVLVASAPGAIAWDFVRAFPGDSDVELVLYPLFAREYVFVGRGGKPLTASRESSRLSHSWALQESVADPRTLTECARLLVHWTALGPALQRADSAPHDHRVHWNIGIVPLEAIQDVSCSWEVAGHESGRRDKLSLEPVRTEFARTRIELRPLVDDWADLSIAGRVRAIDPRDLEGARVYLGTGNPPGIRESDADWRSTSVQPDGTFRFEGVGTSRLDYTLGVASPFAASRKAIVAHPGDAELELELFPIFALSLDMRPPEDRGSRDFHEAPWKRLRSVNYGQHWPNSLRDGAGWARWSELRAHKEEHWRANAPRLIWTLANEPLPTLGPLEVRYEALGFAPFEYDGFLLRPLREGLAREQVELRPAASDWGRVRITLEQSSDLSPGATNLFGHLGYLRLESATEPDSPVLSVPLVAAGPTPFLEVPAGRYRWSAYLAQANQPLVQGVEIVVRLGQTNDVVVPLEPPRPVSRSAR